MIRVDCVAVVCVRGSRVQNLARDRVDWFCATLGAMNQSQQMALNRSSRIRTLWRSVALSSPGFLCRKKSD